MKGYLKYVLVGLLVLNVNLGSAQITAQFIPPATEQNLQSFLFTRLVNISVYPAQVALTIKVKELNHGNVVSIRTAGFLLQSGVSQIDATAFRNARFLFSESVYGNTVKQTGRFPEGEYEYCFEIEVIESKDPAIPPSFEQCFSHQVQPMTPLLLISPVDRDETCNKRPGFIWQPPMPLGPDARFRLVLVEVKDKQEPVEAITFNQSLINQQDIRVNNLPFPINIPELVEGRKYAWQITVYANLVILKKSEVWTFDVECPEPDQAPVAESYREVKESEDGNFYIANRVLRFSINNPYSGGKLHYSIESISEPSKSVKSLPALELRPGLNKYDLDLTDNRSIIAGKEYLLKVFLPNQRQLKLRFTYKNEDL